jgi:hypothetical protein
MKLLTIAALLLTSCAVADARLPKTQYKTCSDGSLKRYTQRCPAPTPTPSPTPTPTPTPTPSPLLGETPIADNFTTSSGLTALGALPGSDGLVGGAFRMFCRAGQLLKDDPLVLPNLPGASHLHQFWGNTGTNAFSTYSSLRTTGQSTCSDVGSGPVNRTAYWIPAMLDGAGNAVKPDGIGTYYKQYAASDIQCTQLATACVPLPHGIRYTFGYNMKTGLGGITDDTSMVYWMVRYTCFNSDGVTQPPSANGRYRTIDEVVAAGCPANAQLHIEWVAPDCWDGVNVDVADHRSHMSYPTVNTPNGAACPASNPYFIPNWSGFIIYATDANFAAGKWRLSSDDMVPGARPGSTLHFDYWEAWSPTVKATWQQYCIDAHKSCSAGDLGNFTQITNDITATRPTHVLVPVN